ncbi:hypothetical protein ACTTAL_09735 [Rhodobacter capsulatus]
MADRGRGLIAFVSRLIRLRRDHPVLRQTRFLHAKIRAQDGVRDLIWRLPSGAELSSQDWHDAQSRCLCAEVRGAAEVPGSCLGEAMFAVFNAGGATEVHLPDGAWRLLIDTAEPDRPEAPHFAAATCVAAQSVQLFIRSTARQEPSP